LGFLNAVETALAEAFVLGNGANLIDLFSNIGGNQLAVSTHAALKVNKVVGLADGADALGNLLALVSEPLMFTAGRFECLLGLLQT